ncbi:hypothetical protein RI367_006144 [Sorochytrium milnesiophthora]
MSSYGDTIRGKLKLKPSSGSLSEVSSGKVKKSRDKEKPEKSERLAGSSSEKEAAASPVVPVVRTSSKTPAQLAFEEAQKKRQKDRISQMANKSHKEKVAAFNEYLGNLSEHYDIPKVGPG